MPTDYTPQDWHAGDMFEPDDASQMSHQVDEEEEINVSQAAQIAANTNNIAANTAAIATNAANVAANTAQISIPQQAIFSTFNLADSGKWIPILQLTSTVSSDDGVVICEITQNHATAIGVSVGSATAISLAIRSVTAADPKVDLRVLYSNGYLGASNFVAVVTASGIPATVVVYMKVVPTGGADILSRRIVSTMKDPGINLTLSAAGTPLAAVPAGTQIACNVVRPKVQEFDTIGTFGQAVGAIALTNQLVPPGAVGLRLTMIPPGTGGGAGRRGAVNTVRCGGGGGATASVLRDLFIPVGAETTWALTLSAGTVGGAAATTDDTNGGNAGNAGTASFKMGNQTTVFAQSSTSSLRGVGGSNASGLGGAFAFNAAAIASGGNAHSTGGVGSVGEDSGWSDTPSGAGSGGGITAANVASNGGAGGLQRQTNAAGGTAGVVDAAVPTGGVTLAGPYASSGAGGGAGSITGPAQDGADGVGYGSPGGGGGASLNGNNSGKGGKGGPAYARLEWIYM